MCWRICRKRLSVNSPILAASAPRFARPACSTLHQQLAGRAAGGQARFADRVRASAADVVRRARAAPPLCPPARPVSPIAPRVRRPRRRLRRGAVESVAARAVLRRGAAGGASEVSRRRPARPPIQRAGPDAHGAHGHELAAPIYARDAPAADPAQPGARARVAGSPRRAAPDPRCRRDGRPHRRHRRLGLPGLQSSPSEGSQLLPPGGPRRADRPHPATQEPPGQRARLQAVGRVPAVPLEFRMDAAFFQRDVLRLLAARRCAYAIKVGYWSWLPLKQLAAERRQWHALAPDVTGFEHQLVIPPWNLRLRVMIYRKHVQHESPKNFQLDLFTPDDGHFEYYAVATNLALSLPALYDFIGGRGAQKKTFAELKGEFSLAVVPNKHYRANRH